MVSTHMWLGLAVLVVLLCHNCGHSLPTEVNSEQSSKVSIRALLVHRLEEFMKFEWHRQLSQYGDDKLDRWQDEVLNDNSGDASSAATPGSGPVSTANATRNSTFPAHTTPSGAKKNLTDATVAKAGNSSLVVNAKRDGVLSSGGPASSSNTTLTNSTLAPDKSIVPNVNKTASNSSSLAKSGTGPASNNSSSANTTIMSNTTSVYNGTLQQGLTGGDLGNITAKTGASANSTLASDKDSTSSNGNVTLVANSTLDSSKTAVNSTSPSTTANTSSLNVTSATASANMTSAPLLMDGTSANITSFNDTSANLTSADATPTNATASSITPTNITSANITPANITSANITSAIITSANIMTTNITSANITSANITSGNITTANITSANTTSANTTSANITSANITSANITAANITLANITSANTTSANMTSPKTTMTNTTTIHVGLAGNITTGKNQTSISTPGMKDSSTSTEETKKSTSRPPTSSPPSPDRKSPPPPESTTNSPLPPSLDNADDDGEGPDTVQVSRPHTVPGRGKGPPRRRRHRPPPLQDTPAPKTAAPTTSTPAQLPIPRTATSPPPTTSAITAAKPPPAAQSPPPPATTATPSQVASSGQEGAGPVVDPDLASTDLTNKLIMWSVVVLAVVGACGAIVYGVRRLFASTFLTKLLSWGYSRGNEAPYTSMSLYANMAGSSPPTRGAKDADWNTNWDNDSESWEDVEKNIEMADRKNPAKGKAKSAKPDKEKSFLDDW